MSRPASWCEKPIAMPTGFSGSSQIWMNSAFPRRTISAISSLTGPVLMIASTRRASAVRMRFSVRPADVRGVLARAHALGFVLVGDIDGDVNARMREAGARARADSAAYGLVRLTLRRR